MPIFQPSILKNFPQNESKIAQRWASYQEYVAKIDFVKSVKEEKYQDGFLKDIFENCLGYTLDSSNPQNFNLEREKKNETDGKKADGVIILNSEVVGIIELKDQKTKNLDTIETQAFNYHLSHGKSKYIIISNFDELRFYIDKKTAYEKFSLFGLSYDEFKKLHLLLSFESIKEDIPLKLKEKSSNFEAEISKQLYKDFSAFRTHLFENIVKNNDQIDKSTLLRLTQKLCDRIIFILFAEDRELLKHNTIKEIRDRYHNDIVGLKIYEYYKIYFNAINEGNDKLSIPKYNGGLFAKDELLDSLKIDDISLDLEAQKLSDYDFASDISVNILGHIFEQSLTDLEEIQSNIDDIAFDKTKSKRKKDGVFYTPEYITKYIVQNTLGKLCDDKKTELTLQNVQNPANPKKLTKEEKQTLQNIYAYREYLLNLKILDPACGSGAFLNQALEFLILEHNNLDMLRRAYENELLSLYDIETNILEHNLYGVDINEDAVEIARLSLWLRTAQRGRTLTNLSGKIKCGNSLIDDKNIVSNAFVWEEEFKEVFENGGFDVVIGNPPYVSAKNLRKIDKNYFESNYITAKSQYDLYTLFIELALLITKNEKYISYILPDKFLITEYGKFTRELVIRKAKLINFEDLSEKNIFEDASVYPVIIVLKKLSEENLLPIINDDLLDYFGFKKDDFIVNKVESIKNRINFDVWRPIATSKNINMNGENIIVSNGEVSRYFISTQRKGVLTEYREKDINKNKILIKKLCYNLEAGLDEKGFMPINTTYCLTSLDTNLKYILCCLNSTLLSKYARNKYIQTALRGGYIELRVNQVKELPIPKIPIEIEEYFIIKADLMLELNKKLQITKQNFHNELGLDKLSQKLQKFEELEFDEFVKEFTKAKKIKFADKLAERNFKNNWSALFENDKKEVLQIQNQINITDKEIDQMVYKLYDLTEDEIKIVEGV